MYVDTFLDFEKFCNKLEKALTAQLNAEITSYFLDNSKLSTKNDSISKDSKFYRYLQYAERKGTLKNVNDHIDPLVWFCDIHFSTVNETITAMTAVGSLLLSLADPTFILVPAIGLIGAGIGLIGAGSDFLKEFKEFHLLTVKVYNLSELKKLISPESKPILEACNTLEIWVYWSDKKAKKNERWNKTWEVIEKVSKEYSCKKKKGKISVISTKRVRELLNSYDN